MPKTNPMLSEDSKEKLIDFELKLKQVSDSMLDGSSPKIRVDALKTFVPLLRTAIKVPGIPKEEAIAQKNKTAKFKKLIPVKEIIWI